MSLPILTSLPNEIRGYTGLPGEQIHCREQGNGTPLILLHQALWSSIHFHRVMPLMAAKGFRVIAPDMPGHGMSSPPKEAPTIPLYAETVIRLMDGLGIERAAVAGHHGGAMVAGRLAAAFPDRVARAAFDTLPFFNDAERAQFETREPIPHRIKPDGSHFTDRWRGVRERGDPEWSDTTAHIAVTTFFCNGPWREQGFDAAFTYDFEPDAPKISCPVLAVYGRTDPAWSHRERLRSVRPDFSYDEFAGAAGMILERPAEWVAKMAPFLRGTKTP